jgi:hypothetical protein
MMSPRSLPSSPTVLLLAMRVGVGGAWSARLAGSWLRPTKGFASLSDVLLSAPVVEAVAESAPPTAEDASVLSVGAV